MKEEGTDATAFRAWRINFISFFVAAGVTLVNIIASLVTATSSSLYFNPTVTTSTVSSQTSSVVRNSILWQYGEVIASWLGAAEVAVGIYFAWYLKDLWYNYDPNGDML